MTTKRTFKARRQRLVAALRSGDFQQGRGQLKAGASLCCLGVACEVSKQGKWELRGGKSYYVVTKDDTKGGYIGTWSSDVALPYVVQKYYGFQTDDGTFTPNGDRISLISLNDKQRRSFAEIATVIESEPDGLFD